MPRAALQLVATLTAAEDYGVPHQSGRSSENVEPRRNANGGRSPIQCPECMVFPNVSEGICDKPDLGVTPRDDADGGNRIGSGVEANCEFEYPEICGAEAAGFMPIAV